MSNIVCVAYCVGYIQDSLPPVTLPQHSVSMATEIVIIILTVHNLENNIDLLSFCVVL